MHTYAYIYVQYIFIAWHAGSSSQLYFLIQLLYIMSDYIVWIYDCRKLDVSFYVTSRALSWVSVLSISLELSLRYQEGAQQTGDCATRPIQRKSAPVSADDVYQGQIRMDRPISSSSSSSARVPSTSRAFGHSPSSASHLNKSHAKSPDATVRRNRQRIPTQRPHNLSKSNTVSCDSTSTFIPRDATEGNWLARVPWGDNCDVM